MPCTYNWKNTGKVTGGVSLTDYSLFFDDIFRMKGRKENENEKNFGRTSFGGNGNYIGGRAGIGSTGG